MELYVRPIPGSPKYVGLAAPHHGQAYGSLIIIDPQVVDDDGMGPVRRFTPEVGFPESQGGRQAYSTPWPLSENYHLCVYDAAMSGAPLRRPGENYGIYLVDAFGNKELIYRDPDIGCMNPIPLRPQPLPAVPATTLAEVQQRKAISIGDQGEATMAVVNVYDTPEGLAGGHEDQVAAHPAAAAVRRAQRRPAAARDRQAHRRGRRLDRALPLGAGHRAGRSRRQRAFQGAGLSRAVLPGARRARHGGHLDALGDPACGTASGWSARAATSTSRRRQDARRDCRWRCAAPPSQPKPDVDGSNPFSYPRLVQPVLDRNCVQCHEENKDKSAEPGGEPIANKFYASYNTLVKYGFTSYGDSYRTRPGQFGAGPRSWSRCWTRATTT